MSIEHSYHSPPSVTHERRRLSPVYEYRAPTVTRFADLPGVERRATGPISEIGDRHDPAYVLVFVHVTLTFRQHYHGSRSDYYYMPRGLTSTPINRSRFTRGSCAERNSNECCTVGEADVSIGRVSDYQMVRKHLPSPISNV